MKVGSITAVLSLSAEHAAGSQKGAYRASAGKTRHAKERRKKKSIKSFLSILYRERLSWWAYNALSIK
jgi:hypothetical protein